MTLPEYVFVVFQSTFAGITGALIVGAFAERMRFRAVLVFCALWFTFAYLPIAHMVWYGPDGYMFAKGALDFAGGTVVHINAGIAGLVGAYMIGPRMGIGHQSMKPHNVTFTMVGAAILWVGWFGFNAGSNLEVQRGRGTGLHQYHAGHRGGGAGLAADRGACSRASPRWWAARPARSPGWSRITPACGTVGPMGALVIGALASVACVWGVTGLKKILRADDALDVFGVHGIGGIVGALLTGVFTAPSLGGTGAADFSIGHQLGVQALGVGVTLVWSGVVSVIAFLIVKAIFGLAGERRRPSARGWTSPRTARAPTRAERGRTRACRRVRHCCRFGANCGFGLPMYDAGDALRGIAFAVPGAVSALLRGMARALLKPVQPFITEVFPCPPQKCLT